MCGITGAFAFNSEGKKFLSAIEGAVCELKKRGPDGNAIYSNEDVALGHCRLSIIDTSTAADQPMYSFDRRYLIVFNGEIVNFKELKEKYLSNKTLRTHSDTEVFLELYVLFGTDCFKLLRGFFAAAIYDQELKKLTLVRDRFGKKPLLYYVSEDIFVFASEMKSLLAFPIPREVNWDILPVYFQLNYIPQPFSIFKNIQKLKQGTFIEITIKNISPGSFYNLEKHESDYQKFNYNQAQKILVNKLDESVRLRMISDVPLGAFLSGGIDSSVVTALASRHTQKLNTFSIGYKDKPYFDETKYANLVAKKYNTEHTVYSLSNNDFLEHIYAVLDYIDEPFADSSTIPEFILSYYTRKHVTVALSGDGGDEVFGGYNKHSAEFNIRKNNLKIKLVKSLRPLWKTLPQSRSGKITNLFRQLNRFSNSGHLTATDRYWEWASILNANDSTNLFSTTYKNKINFNSVNQVKQLFTDKIGNKDLNDILLADMNLVLLSDMLVKVDLMSMANSLEIRSPFLDQEVVEFAFALPSEYKIINGLKKRIVQDAFRSYLPSEIYNRPKKGFEIPLREWLCKDLWPVIEDLLSSSYILEQGIFNYEVIKSLKMQIRSSNPGDSHATLWALVVFQYWWKKYIA